MITLVVTSCGRFDLLARTLSSFNNHADMPVAHVIISEDSGESLGFLSDWHPNTSLINPPERVGQIASIDRAYALVTTPYVFHLEDDWEFHRAGFMRESFKALNADPLCINHWLRERNDTNGHPLDGDRLRPGYNGRWHGFTFNPSLKRMSDYQRLGSYGSICAWDPKDPGKAEAAIGLRYHQMGYHATIAPTGYVKHIGEGRHVQ